MRIYQKTREVIVAPLVGAWIEIGEELGSGEEPGVAPLVGAWIEIHTHHPLFTTLCVSLPSWERGLKLEQIGELIQEERRSPRGSVD